MKRASLPLFLAAAALCAWFLWPREARIVPALQPPSEGVHAAERSAEDARATPADPRSEVALSDARKLAGTRARPSAGPHSGNMVVGWVWTLVGREKIGIADVPAQLWLAAGFEALAPDAKPLAETLTRPMGSFRFDDLARGRYFVSIQREGGARHLTRIDVEGPGDWKTIEFVLGTARVEGLVSPLEGDAQPAIELQSRVRRSRLELRWPDAQGRFAFEDLPAGEYVLRARWRTPGPGAWREDSVPLELAEGGRLAYRVGESVPLAHWRGRVGVAGGEPARADAVLCLEPQEPARDEREDEPDEKPLRPVSEEGGLLSMHGDPQLRVRIGLDAQGRFDVALPRCGWDAALEVDALSHRRRSLDEASLVGGDLQLDLLCPGSRVKGRVEGVNGTGLRVVGWRRTGEESIDQCYVAVDSRGRYVLDGLEEGEWELTVHQPRAAEAEEREPVRVLIESGNTVVKRDL